MFAKHILLVLCLLYAFPVPVAAELSDAAVKSVGRFLAVDLLTAKSPENAKPLRDIFYVKETGVVGQIKQAELAEVGFDDVVLPSHYKGIVIINEVSGLGALARYASINTQNQVFWGKRSYSLKHFLWKTTFGNARIGVSPLLEAQSAEAISRLFRGCQAGKVPTDWAPSEAELSFYDRSLDFFYAIAFSGL